MMFDLLSARCAVNEVNKCGAVVIKVVFLISTIPCLKIQSNNIVIYHYGILAATHNRANTLAK